MDRSPQGPAKVCRMCGFLLEIIHPLVSSRFFTHQQQKLCGHSELNLKAISACLDTFNNKENRRVQEDTRTATFWEYRKLHQWWRFEVKAFFFDKHSNYWQGQNRIVEIRILDQITWRMCGKSHTLKVCKFLKLVSIEGLNYFQERKKRKSQHHSCFVQYSIQSLLGCAWGKFFDLSIMLKQLLKKDVLGVNVYEGGKRKGLWAFHG